MDTREQRGISRFCALIATIALTCLGGCDRSPTEAQADNKDQASQPAKSIDPAMQTLYEAAQKEGGTVIYWSPTESQIENTVAKEFNATFPGVKIQPFSIKPGNAVERIVSEARAGRVSVDLLSTSLASSAPLLDRGLAAPFDGFEHMPESVRNNLLVDGKFINSYNLYYVIAYNTNLISPDLVPHTWADLLNPKLKDKIAIEARVMQFGYLGLTWGQAKLDAYLDQLLAQKPFFVKGGNTLADQVASGEAPIAIGTYSENIELLKADGAPIDSTIPEVLAVSGFGNILVKGAPHPNSAKLYAAWMASDDGQRAMGKILQRGSFFSSVPSSYARKIKAAGPRLVFDDVGTYKTRKQMEEVAAKKLGVIR